METTNPLKKGIDNELIYYIEKEVDGIEYEKLWKLAIIIKDVETLELWKNNKRVQVLGYYRCGSGLAVIAGKAKNIKETIRHEIYAHYLTEAYGFGCNVEKEILWGEQEIQSKE